MVNKSKKGLSTNHGPLTLLVHRVVSEHAHEHILELELFRQNTREYECKAANRPSNSFFFLRIVIFGGIVNKIDGDLVCAEIHFAITVAMPSHGA